MSLTGSMGTIRVGLDFRGGKLKAAVKLKKGWTGYLDVPFSTGGRMHAPVAATPGDIKARLESGFDAVKMTWASKPINLTFVKDVGAERVRTI